MVVHGLFVSAVAVIVTAQVYISASDKATQAWSWEEKESMADVLAQFFKSLVRFGGALNCCLLNH